MFNVEIDRKEISKAYYKYKETEYDNSKGSIYVTEFYEYAVKR